MHSVVLPLLGREGFEQRKICLAQRAKLFERLAGIAFLVMPAVRPSILIESNDSYARRSENETHTIADDDLRIGQMGYDLADRPFLRRRALAQFRSRDALNQAIELARSCSLHGKRIAAFDVAQNALCVLLR